MEPCKVGSCALCPWWKKARECFEALIRTTPSTERVVALEHYREAIRAARETCPNGGPSRIGSGRHN